MPALTSITLSDLVQNKEKEKSKIIDDMAESADYISFGDCLRTTITEKGSWELMPNVGVCSVVAPAILSSGNIETIKFPQYFIFIFIEYGERT